MKNHTTHKYTGFLTEINSNDTSDERRWFVKASIFIGYEPKIENEKPKKKYQFIDLFVAKSLHELISRVNLGGNQGLLCEMDIHGLLFTAVSKEGNAYLNNEGILHSVRFGS